MFTLTIETDNAAFDPNPRVEIVRILNKAILELESGHGYSAEGKLVDYNGNVVGTWLLTEDDDDEDAWPDEWEPSAYREGWDD